MEGKEQESVSSFRILYRSCPDNTFLEISEIISKMRAIQWEFLVVELYGYPSPLEFIQTIRNRENGEMFVEIGLDKGGRHVQMFRSPSISTEACIEVFKNVCVNRNMPDLTDWEDITEEIFPKHNITYYFNKIKNAVQRKYKKLFPSKADGNSSKATCTEESGPPKKKVKHPDYLNKFEGLLLDVASTYDDLLEITEYLAEREAPRELIELYSLYITEKDLFGREVKYFIMHASPRIVRIDLWLKEHLGKSIIEAEKEKSKSVIEQIEKIKKDNLERGVADVMPDIIIEHLSHQKKQ